MVTAIPFSTRSKPLRGALTPSLSDLAGQNCLPCAGIPPMTGPEIKQALEMVPGWRLTEGAITKEFRFSSYLKGLEFAYAIGKLSEGQNHHPSILIGWRKVGLSWYTHSIKGLSKNDFIMAAKSELEYEKFAHQ